MAEVMFVVKSFVIALVVVAGLQMRLGQKSLETHAFEMIRSTAQATGLEKIAQGGALFIKNAGQSVSGFVSKTFGHGSETQQAGRLNLNLKRSEAYNREQAEKENEESEEY